MLGICCHCCCRSLSLSSLSLSCVMLPIIGAAASMAEETTSIEPASGAEKAPTARCEAFRAQGTWGTEWPHSGESGFSSKASGRQLSHRNALRSCGLWKSNHHSTTQQSGPHGPGTVKRAHKVSHTHGASSCWVAIPSSLICPFYSPSLPPPSFFLFFYSSRHRIAAPSDSRCIKHNRCGVP